MTDRGPSSAEGATVCPFVAFEDDRDARADRPDHRHRCFAEVRPAPRALAHQEAYCLSGSFPACPTFQDWAHREAARARRVAAAEAYQPDPNRDEAPAERNPLPPPDRGWVSPAGAVPGEVDDPPHRSRGGRDWKQPPPWSASGAAAAAGAGAAGVGRPDPDAVEDEVETPAFLARRARLEEPRPDTGHAEEADDDDYAPRRERERERSMDRRPRVGASRAHRSEVDPDAPSWERPRRYEAYPTLRTRVGLPNLPRIGVALVAMLIAAAALFFLPPLFLGLDDGGQGGGAGASRAPSPSPSASPEPTPVPSPTPQLYVIKKGDTLSKIATRFGVTIEDLLAANKEAIKNPDRISEGQEIVIPAPPGAGSESPAGEASPSP